MDYSLTYVGVIVIVLAKIATLLGLQIGTAELTSVVTTIIMFGGALVAFYGRWRKGDVNIFGIKKPSPGV